LEQDVLALAALGHSPSAIAEMLGYTPEAVRRSLAAIMARVGARSKMEAVVLVVRHGLIELPPRGAPIVQGTG
jgi:two-component system response regulator DesR